MTAGAARLALNPTRPRSHGTKKYDQTTHLELLLGWGPAPVSLPWIRPDI